MTLLNGTVTKSAEECCHACQSTAAGNVACNAWMFCGESAGCSNEKGSPVLRGTCSLYNSPDLAFNTPLDTINGTVRGTDIKMTSGTTAKS